MEPPASNHQRRYLESLGVPYADTAKMTVAEANKRIDGLLKANDKRKSRSLAAEAARPQLNPQNVPQKRQGEPMDPKPAKVYDYDKLCTRKVDNVPQLVKELVEEMEHDRGHNVFTSDAIRDAVREVRDRLRGKRAAVQEQAKKAAKRKRRADA